jgi:hypothetical protein
MSVSKMSVRKVYPTICSLLKLWGIGDVDSDLTDAIKIRNYVDGQPNMIVEQLISEFQDAIRNAGSIYQELGAATYWRFTSPNQCAAKLTPYLNELLQVRAERYKMKE